MSSLSSAALLPDADVRAPHLGSSMARLTSIVVPTLNEDFSGPAARLNECVSSLPGTFEIVFVDDSPEDHRTCEMAKMARIDPRVAVRVIEGPHAGKGAAVRRGVIEARGSVVFTMDADLPVPLKHVGEFLRLLDDGADVVIAERPLDRKFDSFMRYAVSRGLLVIQRVFVFHSMEFSDTQCGFKAFRGDLARAIARGQLIDGGMYDLEYLCDARRKGAKIVKVPVIPNAEIRESRIDVWGCIRRDWIDVVRVRLKPVRR
jgi:glycosyltransferase involved in cell wall biosynthesis